MKENLEKKNLNNKDIKSDNDSNSENSDQEDYKALKNNIKNKVKKEKNIGKLLKDIIHKSDKIKGSAILSKAKDSLKKLDEEAKEKKELKIKRELRKIQKMFGYKEFNKWDKAKEKKLLKTTTRGVVKLFNSIFEFRKKEKEKRIEDEKKIDNKGSNFLMMHNLEPNFKKKIFEEDNKKK